MKPSHVVYCIGKERKKQDQVTCDICGFQFKTGGIFQHMRQKHPGVNVSLPKAAKATNLVVNEIGDPIKGYDFEFPVPSEVDRKLALQKNDPITEEDLKVWIELQPNDVWRHRGEYTEAITYYRNRPEEARKKWAKIKGHWYYIDRGTYRALRVLCEPNEEDLERLRVYGLKDYWQKANGLHRGES